MRETGRERHRSKKETNSLLSFMVVLGLNLGPHSLAYESLLHTHYISPSPMPGFLSIV